MFSQPPSRPRRDRVSMAAVSRPAAISGLTEGSVASTGDVILAVRRTLVGIGPTNCPQSRLKLSMLTGLPVFLKGATSPLSSTPSISGIISSALSGDGGCGEPANCADRRSRLATSRDLSAKRPSLTGPCGVRPSRPSTANSLILPLSRLNRIVASLIGPCGVSTAKPRISAITDPDAFIQPGDLVDQRARLVPVSVARRRAPVSSPAAPAVAAATGATPTSSTVMPSIRMFRPCPEVMT